MLLPTIIRPVILTTMATIMILTITIERGSRTMATRGILGTERHRLLASVKLIITTGMATTPDPMIAEQGMTIRTILITLTMLDMVGMVRTMAMMNITRWEEATLLVHPHLVMVFVMSTACLFLELRTMTPTTPMDTIILMLLTTTTKGLMIRGMGGIIPLPPAAGVLMVASTPQIPYTILTIKLTSMTLAYNSSLNPFTMATPIHLSSNRSCRPTILTKNSTLRKLQPLVDRRTTLR